MNQFPDPQEISLTPRSDLEIEALALQCSEGWVADQAVYDRLSSDLRAIRQADANMAAIKDYRASPHLKEIIVSATNSETRGKIVAGNVRGFQCVLDALGGEAEAWDVLDGTYAFVRFDGLFDNQGLIELFESIPEVASAEPNALGGDGDSIAYDIRSTTRRYLFDDAGGDCPAGCTTHHYFLWSVDASGPALLAEWGNNDDGTEFGTAPANFSFEDFECRRCADGRYAQGEVEDCVDGVDNDCNGAVDCDDAACDGAQVCEPEDCGNGADDDADGSVDCDDDGCAFNVQCGTLTCGSPEDRAFLQRQADRGVTAFVLRDGLACVQDAERDPALTIASCITRTFTVNNVSFACGRCLGEFGECAMVDCRAECYEGDFHEAPCTNCWQSACAADAETCLGEPVTNLGQ